MRFTVLCQTLLLLALGGVAALSPVLLRDSAEVDRTVRHYASAVGRQDLRGAVAALEPAAREPWSAWVSGQLGNVYDVTGVAVRSPSLLDQWLRGASPVPFEASVRLDVNRGDPGFYQPVTRVGVTRVGGRWYLREPLLASEATRP